MANREKIGFGGIEERELMVTPPKVRVETIAEQREKTLSGTILNALRPWQPYRYFATNEWVEQDYVHLDDYPSGFTPWTDVLSGIGYGFGITPFIVGLSDGIFDPEPVDKKFYKILGESAKGAYVYPRAHAEERLNYLSTLAKIDQIENIGMVDKPDEFDMLRELSKSYDKGELKELLNSYKESMS